MATVGAQLSTLAKPQPVTAWASQLPLPSPSSHLSTWGLGMGTVECVGPEVSQFPLAKQGNGKGQESWCNVSSDSLSLLTTGGALPVLCSRLGRGGGLQWLQQHWEDAAFSLIMIPPAPLPKYPGYAPALEVPSNSMILRCVTEEKGGQELLFSILKYVFF